MPLEAAVFNKVPCELGDGISPRLMIDSQAAQ
jgi:hypothetical protein